MRCAQLHHFCARVHVLGVRTCPIFLLCASILIWCTSIRAPRSFNRPSCNHLVYLFFFLSPPSPLSPPSSVILAEGVMEDLLEDVGRFIADEDWHLSHNGAPK